MEKQNLSQHLHQVEEAFSRQSGEFDALDERNIILKWMRNKVRRRVMALVPAGGHILELNAGTGLDSVYFARHGYQVHATDISQGMIGRLSQKIQSLGLQAHLTAEQRSYMELDGLQTNGFDAIFSNFGGLNCVPDLRPAFRHFPRLLKPGGVAIMVIMPPVSPWEIFSLLKGNTGLAFRRFKKGGALAHIEGVYFKTYYFTSKDIMRQMGPDFRLLGVEALGSLVPPPHLESFPLRFPRVFKTLTRWENKLATQAPFRNCADHFIITMQYIPRN